MHDFSVVLGVGAVDAPSQADCLRAHSAAARFSFTSPFQHARAICWHALACGYGGMPCMHGKHVL